MRALTMVLGISAALLHGVAYLLYARQTKLGQSSPKSASWGLWAFLVLINWLTFGVTIGNWIVALQFLTGSVACIAVFIYMWELGKLSWPTAKEWRLIALGILAVIIWWIFRNAAWANVIIFVALAISFIPIYEDLWENPRKEVPRSWILWTLAFLITAANVVVNWKGQPLSLIMPIGGAMLHGEVAYLSRGSRREKMQAEACEKLV